MKHLFHFLATVCLVAVITKPCRSEECVDYGFEQEFDHDHLDFDLGTNFIAAAGDFVYVANSYTGIQVINAEDPLELVLVNTIIPGGNAGALLADGSFLYTTSNGNGNLFTYDISDPSAPVQVGAVLAGNGNCYGLAIRDTLLVRCADIHGFELIDASNPESLQVIASVETPGYPVSASIGEGFILVSDYHRGVLVVDIAVPERPEIAATIAVEGTSWSVTYLGDTAFIAIDEVGVQIVDLSNPFEPLTIGIMQLPFGAHEVDIVDGRLYVSSGGFGLRVFDLGNPRNPIHLGAIEGYGYLNMAFNDECVFNCLIDGGVISHFKHCTTTPRILSISQETTGVRLSWICDVGVFWKVYRSTDPYAPLEQSELVGVSNTTSYFHENALHVPTAFYRVVAVY